MCNRYNHLGQMGMRGVTEWRGGRGYISIEAIIQVMLTGSQSEGVAQRTGFLLSSSSLLLPFRRHRRPMDGLAEEPLGVINEMRGLILRERERGRGRERVHPPTPLVVYTVSTISSYRADVLFLIFGRQEICFMCSEACFLLSTDAAERAPSDTDVGNVPRCATMRPSQQHLH